MPACCASFREGQAVQLVDSPGQTGAAAPSDPIISVLAYHLVHTIRFQLKAAGIDLSWEGVRRALAGQDRVTATLKRADGKTIHIRKATRAEPRQQLIYDALGIGDRPGRIEKTLV